jgi:hypothetical protein
MEQHPIACPEAISIMSSQEQTQMQAGAEKDATLVVTTTPVGHLGELTSSPIEESKETKEIKVTEKTSSWSSQDSEAETSSSIGNRPFWRQWLVEVVFCVLSLLSFISVFSLHLCQVWR